MFLTNIYQPGLDFQGIEQYDTDVSGYLLEQGGRL